MTKRKCARVCVVAENVKKIREPKREKEREREKG